MMAIPRIGHEVTVSFLDADPDQPLITGRVRHAAHPPPYALPEHKTRTVIRSQSHQSRGYSEISLEDKRDGEEIYIRAQKDLNLLTLNDRREEIRRDSALKIHRDRIEQIERDAHLSVHGQRRTRVDGDDHARIGGTAHRHYGRALLVEAGEEIHAKAGNKVVLDAGAELTIQAGGSFIKLDPSGVTIAGPVTRINAGGSPGSGTGQSVQMARLPGQVEEVAPPPSRVGGARLERAAEIRPAFIEVCQLPADGSPCPLGASCPCGEG
ncbi:hypothetical protein GCM10007160_05190 [Litchfieldella qijiaojingensis]|uniref:Gp5/Type VI secretion system Vgr C-terminal trimerisation domain-containing protein n=1 Tax=Litchfieldella qijiaojingensis TaxID=980347 RepID=A0ABQ2YG09_9GAMM|nr:hypothetical protein [Halomonas qijiaojingensis]GGX80933.1 hypothetical protein GCM10007160_05190 [Halomonas qijiaojingensis]